jgi:hypothetical protein
VPKLEILDVTVEMVPMGKMVDEGEMVKAKQFSLTVLR